MMTQNNIIIAIIVGVLLLLVFGKIIFLPIRIVSKLLINTIVGGVIIFVVNYFGDFFGIHIALNLISALIVGVLGIPGVGLLFLIKYFL